MQEKEGESGDIPSVSLVFRTKVYKSLQQSDALGTVRLHQLLVMTWCAPFSGSGWVTTAVPKEWLAKSHVLVIGCAGHPGPVQEAPN